MTDHKGFACLGPHCGVCKSETPSDTDRLLQAAIVVVLAAKKVVENYGESSIDDLFKPIADFDAVAIGMALEKFKKV